jgi:hypothetical protein
MPPRRELSLYVPQGKISPAQAKAIYSLCFFNPYEIWSEADTQQQTEERGCFAVLRQCYLTFTRLPAKVANISEKLDPALETLESIDVENMEIFGGIDELLADIIRVEARDSDHGAKIMMCWT